MEAFSTLLILCEVHNNFIWVFYRWVSHLECCFNVGESETLEWRVCNIFELFITISHRFDKFLWLIFFSTWWHLRSGQIDFVRDGVDCGYAQEISLSRDWVTGLGLFSLIWIYLWISAERRNSGVLGMEWCLSCTNPLIWRLTVVLLKLQW